MDAGWQEVFLETLVPIWCRPAAAAHFDVCFGPVSDAANQWADGHLRGIFAPALLQLQASREISTSNIYSGRFSGVGYVHGVLVFGMMALLVLLYQLVLQIAG